MNTSESILVVILSSFLAIFLVLGIVVLTKLIDLINNIKRITEKAEDFADKAEAVGDFFQKTAGPAVLMKAFSKAVRSYTKRRKE